MQNGTAAEVRGVTANIAGTDGSALFDGAAVLRHRAHPISGDPILQLGVPDDALGFRPKPAATYEITVEAEDERPKERYRSRAVWLERVQTSWWFILEPLET
jgi:hypothetical protein